MSKFVTRLLCAAAAAGIAAAATPAAAQRVDRIVAFGDSYADDGNLFELVPSAYTDQARLLYPTGRFSGGSNFVDTMSQLLNAPVDNFAIGGAFTGTANINSPMIPGFFQQWQSYLAGGGPAAFPRVSGTFDAQDLVVVSIGGNDARAYEQSLGLNPTAAQIESLIGGAPGQAAIRVAEATAGLEALVGAGAQNITFLAGDVGRLPEVAGLPVAAVGSAYAAAFNSGIQNSLAELASRGVIVNYLDLNLIGDQVENNLAAFGLTSAGACPAPQCITDPNVAGQYLFYVDRVHLTSAGFAIVGRYAVRQLEAPLHLQAQADAGLQAATSFAHTLLGRLELSDARFGNAGGSPLHFYISANAARRDRPDTMQSLGYTLGTYGVTGGAEYDAGAGFIFGGAVNWSRSEAEMNIRTGATETDAIQLGLYGGWSGGGAFVEAYGSFGWLDYDIRRDAVIDEISASPEGETFTVGGRVGYLMDLGAVRLGPVAGLRHARADLDAYTETGDPVLTLNVSEQRVESLIGSLGLEARGDVAMAGATIQPYLSAALEHEFEEGGRTIRYAGTAPTIVNSWVLPGNGEDTYARLSGGVNVALTTNVALQLHASTTIESGSGDEAAGALSLRIGF